MKKSIIIATLFLLAIACGNNDMPDLAPVDAVIDDYYGLEVEDPYRYMENMDDTVFLNWMKGYADYSRGVLDHIPGREILMEQFRTFDSRRKESIHTLQISETGRYFYLKLTPEDETANLYYRERFETEEKILYDPAQFEGTEGSNYVIAYIVPDQKGEIVGVALAPDGSESLTMIFIDVDSGEVLSDQLTRVFGSFSWIENGTAIIYGRTNSENIHDPDRMINTNIYYHRMGMAQSTDRIVYSNELYPGVDIRPEELPIVYLDHNLNEYFMVVASGRYIKAFRNNTPISPGAPQFSWEPLFDYDDEVQDFYVLNHDVYLYTAKNAPNFRILKTSKIAPEIEKALVVVPEPQNGLISGFGFTSEALFYKIKEHGVRERLFMVPGYVELPREIELPVSAGYLGIRTRGHSHDDIWINITGWTMDGKRYRYHPIEDEFVVEQLSRTGSFPEFNDIVVEEIMVPSHDGVMVPLSLIYRQGAEKAGPKPVLMNGFGAYGKSRIPIFNPYILTYTLMDGIFAVAHVRGGGELGDAWRIGGRKENKPNSWKDFIACAEYLVENDYTSSNQFSIYGGSAGGILIGRAMTERPDLFSAAIPMVGVMNPLRLEESPNGPSNASEFGTVYDSAECMALIEMDSYLHVEDGVKYPATLITAGFNDPRVIVWQPAKFAARLQAANESNQPILFDVDYTSGHGLGDTKSQSFQDVADLISFSLWTSGHPNFQMK